MPGKRTIVEIWQYERMKELNVPHHDWWDNLWSVFMTRLDLQLIWPARYFKFWICKLHVYIQDYRNNKFANLLFCDVCFDIKQGFLWYDLKCACHNTVRQCFIVKLCYYIIRLINYWQLSRIMSKSAFSICKNEGADQLRLIWFCACVFARLIVWSLYLLNPKFQASNHLMWLFSGKEAQLMKKPSIS